LSAKLHKKYQLFTMNYELICNFAPMF